MKILYVITGLELGGAEKVVIDLAEQMYQRGHFVKIAYLTGEVSLSPKFPEIELVPLNLNSLKDILKASKYYQKLLIGFQPDVVHAHMVHANIFTRINRLFQSVPKLISSAHSNNEGGKLRIFLYRLTHYLADVTTNVSQNAVQQFEKLGAVPENNMLTVYNGIDLNKFRVEKNSSIDLKKKLDLDLNQKIILAVGRLTDPKDYPNLIHAIYFLKKNTTWNFQLIIVGEGVLRYEIENLISTLDLNQQIKLLGRRDDIPDLMNIADIYVLSSKFEGFGLVLAEAMACEKFVVATNCGGSAEIIGDTGILVPPQNSEKLAQAIEKVLSLSEQEIINNGKLARQRVEKLFSLESSINKWLELYESK